MSWSLFTITGTALIPVLTRIADALDRIAPLPEADVPEVPAAEAVTYTDDALIAQREQAEEMHALEKWLDEHPEFREETEDANVQSESD